MDLETIKRELSGRSFERAQPDRPHLLAAVGLILKPTDAKSDVEILLIRRAERDGDPWSGQMGLPGGRYEPHDADQYATVVRETREEVGLDLNTQAELIGRLDDTPATARTKRTGLVIAPHVFSLHHLPPLTLNDEVAEALWAPLGPMMRGEIDAITEYWIGQENYVLPAYSVQGHIVWGLTYGILQNLFSKLGDRQITCNVDAGFSRPTPDQS